MLFRSLKGKGIGRTGILNRAIYSFVETGEEGMLKSIGKIIGLQGEDLKNELTAYQTIIGTEKDRLSKLDYNKTRRAEIFTQYSRDNATTIKQYAEKNKVSEAVAAETLFKQSSEYKRDERRLELQAKQSEAAVDQISKIRQVLAGKPGEEKSELALAEAFKTKELTPEQVILPLTVGLTNAVLGKNETAPISQEKRFERIAKEFNLTKPEDIARVKKAFEDASSEVVKSKATSKEQVAAIA